MDMETLYGWMKDSLNLFGVGFHDMKEVDVYIEGKTLVFERNGVRVAIFLEKK